mgnify:FL=1
MMQFTFDIPFKFERVYNFDNPILTRNDYWYEDDSNPKLIKEFKHNTMQTLVKSLEIYKLKKEKYLVVLNGATDSKDVFYVPIELLPNFLERFDLL